MKNKNKKESGKKPKNECSLMLVPMIFFYRRLLYVYSALLLGEYLLLQLVIQIFMIQFFLTILYSFRPLESRLTLHKQTFDEFTYLFLIYILLCFTNFIPDPIMRSKLGVAYNSVIFTNVGFHLIFMIKSIANNLVLGVKRIFARRRLYKYCCIRKNKILKKNKTREGIYQINGDQTL